MACSFIVGSCKCSVGFSGIDCSGSKSIVPTPDPSVHCTGKIGCEKVVITGSGFVNSPDLKCKFTTITVSSANNF